MVAPKTKHTRPPARPSRYSTLSVFFMGLFVVGILAFVMKANSITLPAMHIYKDLEMHMSGKTPVAQDNETIRERPRMYQLPAPMTPPNTIAMYMLSDCSISKRRVDEMKGYARKHKFEFDYHVVDTDKSARRELSEALQKAGVPGGSITMPIYITVDQVILDNPPPWYVREVMQSTRNPK